MTSHFKTHRQKPRASLLCFVLHPTHAHSSSGGLQGKQRHRHVTYIFYLLPQSPSVLAVHQVLGCSGMAPPQTLITEGDLLSLTPSDSSPGLQQASKVWPERPQHMAQLCAEFIIRDELGTVRDRRVVFLPSRLGKAQVSREARWPGDATSASTEIGAKED